MSFSLSLMCICRGAQRAVSAGYPPQARMWTSGSKTTPWGTTHTNAHTLCPAQSVLKCCEMSTRVVERAVFAVWHHENRTAGENQKTGGRQTEYRLQLRYKWASCSTMYYYHYNIIFVEFYVLFSQSGVMIPEMTDAKGRACLVSQRGRRRWP